MNEAGRPEPENLPALAVELRAACRNLKQSLDLAVRAKEEELEAACASHLERLAELRAAVRSRADTLNAGRARIEALPAAERGRVLASMRESRKLLERASENYGLVADRLADELQALDERLGDLRQGGRVLQCYREAAE